MKKIKSQDLLLIPLKVPGSLQFSMIDFGFGVGGMGCMQRYFNAQFSIRVCSLERMGLRERGGCVWVDLEVIMSEFGKIKFVQVLK